MIKGYPTHKAGRDTTPIRPHETGKWRTTSPAKARCHPDYSPCLPLLEGDALNCGDLTAAQKPVTVRDPGVDPYRLDGDGDGQGCTS